MKRLVLTITADHVRNPRSLGGKLEYALRNAIGRLLPRDVGKRVFDTGDGVLQVENDEQRAARLPVQVKLPEHAGGFIPQLHTHVLFEGGHGLETGSFEGPCAIILHTGDRVWVGACYSDFPADPMIDVVQVSDGKHPYDWQGGCIASVNAKHVRCYLAQEEADQIEECMAADRRLLSYAR